MEIYGIRIALIFRQKRRGFLDRNLKKEVTYLSSKIIGLSGIRILNDES